MTSISQSSPVLPTTMAYASDAEKLRYSQELAAYTLRQLEQWQIHQALEQKKSESGREKSPRKGERRRSHSPKSAASDSH
ncbi:hypothetical protein SERLA73DRAFT_180891 [Serpula lacrymans var. lacrymans S7.3]|uniref:Uncharacterized protein n=2 Tax=Serpula lacrymans var. lacrymans TaxID=341189 RepID=F8PWL5_SERL3|nr:uncharacterized protein SERLADRAFT_466695 [Serpula lacrymans var. lacrymans S7.9]EGO00339.1 hypothetical protein SERLA73DRAFT_180891 [Serpula lacrymans var. lacrymans S7.3]EGO25899.1 hypothetical protein SERLADRAFT_466695 [Serpula lacrymans var. lacrymans S7.9]